ncbi:MAG: hypothetical protein ABWY05_10755 [Noviherbaspirillum sp.]
MVASTWYFSGSMMGMESGGRLCAISRSLSASLISSNRIGKWVQRSQIEVAFRE